MTLFGAAGAFGNGARLDWVDKVVADGQHNAFTDLAFWRGAYYLCFRSGASHGSMDGQIRILRSADARTWEPSGALDTLGDDRDPHFAVAGDTLHVFFGVWDLKHGAGPALPDRGAIRSHVASTSDGKTWSGIKGVYEPGWWLWRVIRHGGTFYAGAYTAYRPKPAARELCLLTSPDGLDWSLTAAIAKDRLPTESDLWFGEDGTLNVVTRMADTVNEAFWFRSSAGLEQWTGDTVGAIIHSPAVARWGVRVFVAGRGKSAEGWVTRLWELRDGKALELLTLPSGGDTAYPGLMADPAADPAGPPALLISWYSQHELPGDPPMPRNASHVYVGRVVVGE
jgi:hypothetical protein